MTFDPAPDHGRELAGLLTKSPILPRRDPHRVFVETNLRAGISRIEMTIEARLSEKIDGRPKLGVEEKCETGTEEPVRSGVDQTGRGLIELVELQINRAAQSGAQPIIRGAERKLLVQPIEEIVRVEIARGKKARAERESA